VDRAAKAGLATEATLEILLEWTFAGLVGMVDNLAGRVEPPGRGPEHRPTIGLAPRGTLARPDGTRASMGHP
jgi:hypothetical protein